MYIEEFFVRFEWSSFIIILKKFLKFPKSEPRARGVAREWFQGFRITPLTPQPEDGGWRSGKRESYEGRRQENWIQNILSCM